MGTHNTRSRWWERVFNLWSHYIANEHLPQLDRWLAHQVRALREMGKRDRRQLSEAFFGLARYAVWVTQAKSRDDLIQKLRYTPSEILFFSAVERLKASLTPPEPGFFPPIEEPSNGFRVTILTKSERPQENLTETARWRGFPPWMLNALEARAKQSGWSIEAFLERHETRPPLWLRARSKEDREKAYVLLRKDGLEASLHEELALKIRGPRSVYACSAFKDGLFEVQDLASQKAGSHTSIQPGEFVWDCCAGGGGKTLQIAAHLQGKGAVYASDIREKKLEETKRRAKRAQAQNIRTMPWDGVTLPSFGREIEKRGGFDCVFVDAPCSGIGTWRRNPDGVFRFDPAQTEALTKIQLTILRTARQALRPGGRLVYATCSWLIEENESVVSAFLEKEAELKLHSERIHGFPLLDSDTHFSALFTN